MSRRRRDVDVYGYGYGDEQMEDGEEVEEDDEDEFRSVTLSGSEDGGGRGGPHSNEPAASKRERMRRMLMPAIQSRVTALGGLEEVVVRPPARARDEDSSDVDPDEDEDDQGNDTRQGETVQVYKLGDEVLGCLKDLKRFWRMDDNDDDRTIARFFFETGVLANDLVHILNAPALRANPSTRQEKAALAAADLIAAMTWPINVKEELLEIGNATADGDKAAIEAAQKIDYASLLAAQRHYKAVIIRSGCIKTLCKMLVPRLEKGMRDRTERDENIISLILHIWRNLAAIKDRPPSIYQSSETIEESHLQSELICQFASESVFDLLVLIASLSGKNDYNQWNMLVLEIMFLLFRAVDDPSLLVKRNEDVSKIIREDKLNKLLDAEKSRKRMDGRSGVTRHSRFGTTVVIENGKDRIVMHKQAAVAVAASNPGKLIDDSKQKGKRKQRETNDLAPPSHLRPEAIRVLQAVSMSFLESAFNPFFASVLRDIRMERAKVREVDNIRFLFLVRLFLEYFLALREYELSQGVDMTTEEGHDFDLIAEATDPASIVYVCLRMKAAQEDQPTSWTELHAAVACFIQLLHVMDALQQSGNEEYKEVSEILQNKLYYEPATLEIVFKLMTTYTHQPIKYLDTVIHLASILLKMLERYSKNTNYMFVRKRAAKNARQKKAQANGAEEDGMDEEEAEIEQAEQGSTYKEHKFTFESMERKLGNEAVVATLLEYLELYKDYTSENQMKRVVGLLHRIAVKAELHALFYRVTTLELFRRILDDQPCLPKTAPYKDLTRVITFVLKNFFKLAQTNELLFVEALFPHTKHELKRDVMKIDSDDDKDGDDGAPKPLRMPADIRVRKGHSWSDQMGIAVGLLSDRNRDDLLTWVKDTMSAVAKDRLAVIEEIDKDRLANLVAEGPREDEGAEAFELRKMKLSTAPPSAEALAALSDHQVDYEGNDELQDDCTRNPPLKLLLRLVDWTYRESDERTHLLWTIPGSLAPAALQASVRIIDQYLLEPFVDEEEGKAVEELVTKVAKARPARKARSPSAGSGQDSADDDAALFSDPEIAAAIRGAKKKSKPKPKRNKKLRQSKGDGSDEEAEGDEAARRRKKRSIEEVKSFRTAQFILDSDDDEEADRAFFAREAALRAEMDARAGKGNGVAEPSQRKKEPATKKGKKAARGKSGANVDSGSDGPGKDIPGANASASALDSDSDAPLVRKATPPNNKRPKPRAKPTAKASKRPRKRKPSSEEESEAEQRDVDDGDEDNPEDSPATRLLKRARREAEQGSDEDAGSGKEVGSKSISAAVALQPKRGRMVVDSDEED